MQFQRFPIEARFPPVTVQRPLRRVTYQIPHRGKISREQSATHREENAAYAGIYHTLSRFVHFFFCLPETRVNGVKKHALMYSLVSPNNI